ncbi:MAG: hypothetical protein ABH834_05965 [Candidatus Altiarchaeota archaeon]
MTKTKLKRSIAREVAHSQREKANLAANAQVLGELLSDPDIQAAVDLHGKQVGVGTNFSPDQHIRIGEQVERELEARDISLYTVAPILEVCVLDNPSGSTIRAGSAESVFKKEAGGAYMQRPVRFDEEDVGFQLREGVAVLGIQMVPPGASVVEQINRRYPYVGGMRDVETLEGIDVPAGPRFRYTLECWESSRVSGAVPVQPKEIAGIVTPEQVREGVLAAVKAGRQGVIHR